jgi:cyclohexanone monooxygenase
VSLPPEEVRAELELRWLAGGAGVLGAFPDVLVDAEANAVVAAYLKDKVREIVQDPRTAELLTSQDYPVGARRIVVGPGFHEMFNQPHVELVDVLGSPIQEITAAGIRTADRVYDVDDIVCATGYDALTGALLAMDIRGRGGEPLAEHWAAGLLLELRARGATTVEPTPQAAADWVRHVNDVAGSTLLLRASSWYMGANIPGKPRVFMPYVGGVPAYREICDKVAANGYEGMVIR